MKRWTPIAPDVPARRWGCLLIAAAAAAGLLGACTEDSSSPPVLAVSPSVIQLAVGDSAAVLEVRNGGKGVLTWELEEDAPWLSAEPEAGSTDGRALVTLHVLADSLPQGPHVAQLAISSNGGDTVARIRMWDGFTAGPDTLQLVAGELPGEVRLSNAGDGPMAWSAGATPAWLQVSPAQGSLADAPETLQVSIDRTGLAPGSYSGLVWIDAQALGADTVRVLLAVPQSAAVSGRVTYQGTRIPTPGVRVSAGAIADTTDAGGNFLLPDVPLGERTLIAERVGFTPAQALITVPAEGLTRDLSITSETQTCRITGTLTNILGAGLVYASVTLLNPDGTDSEITTRTRDGGAYALERVPPGARQLRFSALKYQPLLAEVEAVAGTLVYDARAVAALREPPEPQSGPRVAMTDCERIRVSWTPGVLAAYETVAGYCVERAPAATGPFEDASGLVAGAATDHFDDTDWEGPQLHYRVLTVTIDGDPGAPGLSTGFILRPWVELTPSVQQGGSPEERWGQAAVCDPDGDRPRKLIMGGTGCESGTCGIDFGDVWALDLADLTWQRLDSGTGPADRNEHSLVLDRGRHRVITYGGKLGEGEQIYGDTWAFDLETSSWTLLNDGRDPDAAPAARFGHTAVLDVSGDRMLIYGGVATSLFNDVWSFDLSSNQWTRLRSGQIGELDPQPEARRDHVAVFDPVEERMVVQGGLGIGVNNTLSDTWAFELSSMTWDPLPEGPARCRHMIDYDPIMHRGVFVGGWTYGGEGQSAGRFNDVWAFDLATDQWLELDGGDEENRPEKRDRHSMVLRPDTGALYIFGGLLELSGLGADTWTYCAGGR